MSTQNQQFVTDPVGLSLQLVHVSQARFGTGL